MARFSHLFVPCCLLILTAPAACQESINVPAPTQPAVGVVAYRQQFRWTRYSWTNVPTCCPIEDWQAKAIVTYGVAGNLALEAQVPIDYRSTGDSQSDRFSPESIRLGFKLRLWQNDSGPTDTTRISLLAGVLLPSGPAEMAGVGVRPQLGAVAMRVQGRHGVAAAARFSHSDAGPISHIVPTAGPFSVWDLDAAYLYRVRPAVYSLEDSDAWYLVGELSHTHQTNGDWETRLAPGLLFEGARFAAEIGVQLPAASRLVDRPRRDFSVVAGLRLLF